MSADFSCKDASVDLGLNIVAIFCEDPRNLRDKTNKRFPTNFADVRRFSCKDASVDLGLNIVAIFCENPRNLRDKTNKRFPTNFADIRRFHVNMFL